MSKYTSVFEDKIIRKKQLLFLIEDEDGEKFGYYLNTEIIARHWGWNETDGKSFHFNLQSNDRFKQPMKFRIKELKHGGYYLHGEYDKCLISLGDIGLCKENFKNNSNCSQNEWRFDYHGIENALCGKEGWFTPKRILVIQMK